MSKSKVVIIDYGVGNLLSVQRAVEECGAEAIISQEPDVIIQADRVILPGVGAFGGAMRALEALGLLAVIKAIALNGTPLLGICLGMQLLFDESEEHGFTKGLGIIPGRVVPVFNKSAIGVPLKIPHIGWNSLDVAESSTWTGSILQGLTPGDAVYFLHSFMAEPKELEARIFHCLYGGKRIVAAIGYKNIFGCQFHPEKSGSVGLKILRNFLMIKKLDIRT